ncbi:MAG: urate hydroxylase PuuD [Pseudorhodoplanes sp.]|jgi:uncharacterized membrane protein|nr:urate hydroxylase PuuD [Pseudorhodoplanes sp.]
MDVFLGEWGNLLLRWAHMIVGIGWIGTSFYFIALDYSLNQKERKSPGVFGTAWQVHGGGFYHVEKFTVAPPHLPEHLHWFKWEAYLTWVTGFGLLIVQYYFHASAYLIDPAVMPLSTLQAVGLSVASLLVGWFVYDQICKFLGERTVPLAIAVFLLIMAASVFYMHVFSGRGAFIHVGALIGTIMAFNVFVTIIPGQKIMVGQLLRGEEPEAKYGKIAKQRSLHNNYLTLPVLLMMVSPHYPFLAAHPQAWLIVALILITGSLFRHVLNRIDAGDDWNRYGWAAPVAIFALLCAIYATAPSEQAEGGPAVTDAEALSLTTKHCVMCHAKRPTHESFQEPPKNVTLETLADLKRYAQPIMIQAVRNKAMPLGNQTQMTDEEREQLGRWIRSLR